MPTTVIRSRHATTASSSSSSGLSRAASAAAVALGLFFLVSGASKLLNVAHLVELVGAYGIPSPLSFAAAFIPPLEIALGLGLILGIRRAQLGLASAGLLAAFTVAFGLGYLFGGVEECGCFGDVEFLQTSPLGSLIRNIVLIAISVFVWQRSGESSGKMWKAGLLLMALLPVFTVSGMSSVRPFVSGSTSSNSSLAFSWRGQPVVESPLSSYVPAHADSTYLLFAYSFGCRHCIDVIENVNAYVGSGVVDKVAGITVSSPEAKASFYEHVQPEFPTQLISPDQMGSITDGVPVAFFIKDGRVAHVARGSQIGSPHNFRRYVLPEL